MDHYDDDAEESGMQFFSVLEADGPLAREKDPYMAGSADSDSDSEDYHEIRPEDLAFVAVEAEEESCSLEMYVYDADEATMFVHHDLMLGAYPLCVDWLSATPEAASGNFAVVGLYDHNIELWDLDRLEVMHPSVVLGAERKKAPKSSRGKLKKKKREATTSHGGPVLCLHGSPFNRSVVASGSADQSVKVWDVSSNACVHTYGHHSDKVQCVRWHSSEQALLLSAAFDRRLTLLDVRQPGKVATAELPGEAECGVWSRHNPFECLASADDGRVVCYDVRRVANGPSGEHALWTLEAHGAACTAVQDAPTKNLLVTCSLDETAKVWNLASGAPSLALSKNLQAGPLFACESCAEEPGLLCFGGKCPVVWDLASEELLLEVFPLAAGS